ncbi:hypothetical protein D3C76_1648040 [compost metagenome]
MQARKFALAVMMSPLGVNSIIAWDLSSAWASASWRCRCCCRAVMSVASLITRVTLPCCFTGK